MRLIRPIRNLLAGCVPSYAMGRVLKESHLLTQVRPRAIVHHSFTLSVVCMTADAMPSSAFHLTN